LRWGTDLGSSDITHLHEKLCERIVRVFATPPPGRASPGEPAPRSQGCEVARVLHALDTVPEGKFPVPMYESASQCKDFPKTNLSVRG
jgi:hypothetical protein